MSVSMGDVQDSIKAAVVGTAGTAHAKGVSWVNEPRGAGSVICILDILYAQSLQDRNCHVQDDEDPTIWYWRLSSLYYIRVQVRCEAILNAPNSDAMVALQKIRAGLLNPSLEMDDGVVIQHDNDTYIHHISFPHQGHTISAYAFEVGFRAVVDAPLDPATEDGAPNMQAVIFEETEVDVDEAAPVDFDQTIERPIVVP